MSSEIIFDEQVLDQGFVRVYDGGVFGEDKDVVNAARVSFGKMVDKVDEKDAKLIKYLAEHKHFSPFRHNMIRFHVKAPEFVMRQWYKHVVGIETSSSYATKDHAWNEISGRYVPVSSFYEPDLWRKQAEINKQGSDGQLDDLEQVKAAGIFDTIMDHIIGAYEQLLEVGVAKEQARMILPLNQYTEVIWTASFQAIANFIELRCDSHAQWEIQQFGNAIQKASRKFFPITTEAWFPGTV